MGTFGTGPFSSDGALDFLEELAERPPEQHLDALRHMFTYVLTNRDLLWREFFPDQVVAAAALVAATLPGGEHLQHRLAELADETDIALLPTSALGLAAPALEALLFVAGPDGPWHQGWTTKADRLDAQRTVHDLAAILRAAI
ncbi:DUF4259 domain-containing protein [Micromonospora chaiyaphumensis]|uniref:Uncharacterized protein n=1 Tax=Micromonospora chaiyaphumensis TaxID=307119 RepID=A0A1C4W9F2_9ACTN|nr:DUF4259 domain-containing protein [Micromonospora chaiyaphumensis]SCE92803.1 protein of unknown function [Micromonospora chaiyaphumensis]